MLARATLLLSLVTLTGALQCTTRLPAQRVAPAARRAVAAPLMGFVPQNVGEAKVKFQESYGRPTNVAVQGFVQEMLTSTQCVLITPTYEYSRVFSVGFDSLCTVFLAASPSEEDKLALRSSMLKGLGFDPATVQKDAEQLTESATGLSEEALFETDDFKKIAAKENFKYSYTFGAGLISLMQTVGVEPGDEAIDRWCEKLGMKSNTLKRDYAYFKDSMQKMEDVKEMMVQMKISAKRQEAARLAEKAKKAEKEAEEAEAAEKAKEAA